MLFNSSLGLGFINYDSLNQWILANKDVLIDDLGDYLYDDDGVYLYI